VRIDALLPQTQCRRCGHDGCLPYARAVAAGEAINRCPPGGTGTIDALARLLDREVLPPDPACGPTPARRVASIDNDACIGCTKCILACPVDAIVGAARHQHHVLADRCTGCDLCLPPCPVDCIAMVAVDQAWSPADQARGRANHQARGVRLSALAAPPRQRQPSDPRATLAAPAERARRLDAILERARGASAR
jgi:electron transport complex protein RnfB